MVIATATRFTIISCGPTVVMTAIHDTEQAKLSIRPQNILNYNIRRRFPTTISEVRNQRNDMVRVIAIRPIDSTPFAMSMCLAFIATVSYRPPVVKSIILQSREMGWGRDGRAVAVSDADKAKREHLRSIFKPPGSMLQCSRASIVVPMASAARSKRAIGLRRKNHA